MTDEHADANDPVAAFHAFSIDEDWWGARAQLLVDMPNGFEKWLVTDWLLWMRHRRGLAHTDVGIEYKAGLAPDLKFGDKKKRKQVDLWWSVSGVPKRWNFVELKLVFANGNGPKMFQSAGWDLWYLSRLLGDERPHAAAVIVVGSGFTDEQRWRAGVESVTKESANTASPGKFGSLGALRWQAWQLRFP